MNNIFPLNDLIPEIISENNMYDSFDYVIDHLEYKQQREKYRPHRQSIVEKLTMDIGSGTFRILPEDVRDIHVKDGPKERDCQAPKVYKRIGIHAIMVIVEKYTYTTLIKNTAASVKGNALASSHH